VHGLPQHDDSKEGGIEHGDAPGMAVVVPKLRAVHGYASGMCCVWQRRRFVAPWIGKTPIFSLLNTAIYLIPIFGGRMSFTNWVREWRGSNTYCR
jgi:hypothetical protein